MIVNEDFEAFLATICPDMGDAALVAPLRAMARTVTVERGKLARIDQNIDQLVFVADGATKLVAHASAGREQVVAFHFAGDLVSVPARATHVYTLTALAPATLLMFPARRLLDLMAHEPAVLSVVIDRMLIALHRCRDKTVSLGRKTAAERIAGFLVTMAERIGRTNAAGVRLDLPMSRRDIGDSLGLTIETVSRQFTELRTEGLLTTSGRSIVDLCDTGALAARAGQLAEAN